MPIDKPLPAAIEAEESFLSACLTGLASEASELLSGSDFYKSGHQVIFAAVAGMVKAQEPVDIVTVIDRLRASGELEKAGGASYVSRLQDCASATTIEHLAEIIKRASTRRRIIQACGRSMQACLESDDIDGILGDLSSDIAAAEQNISSDSWVKIGSFADDMIQRWEMQKGMAVTGISTGFIDLDAYLNGWQDSTLYIVAGRPSMGKSAFALKVAQHAARRGRPVGFRSIEMSKEQLFTRNASDMSGVDSERFRSGEIATDQWGVIVEAVSKMYKMPIYIDDKPVEKIRNLQRSIRQFVKRYGHGLIIIDYLQYIEGEKSERFDLQIGTITRGLKSTARELKIPIVLLAQLNRKLEERDNKRPKKSDLRGSGEIEQDADVVMFLYRDEVYDPKSKDAGIAEVIIDKHRDGKTGTIKLAWVSHRATFENLAR